MDRSSHILLVFVDGLGLGPANPDLNPIQPDICPHLCDLLANFAVPIDATLGVPGLPQSATGQTALLPLTEQKDILFLLTSDHGNIEDLSTIRHTMNPVPFVAKGYGANALRTEAESILQITPAILECFRKEFKTCP